jgi:hypothetical protein
LRATECCACAATPAPDSWIENVFVALLEIARPPVTPPAAFGSKVIVIVTDWFGVSMTPDPPLAAKPVPEAATLEMLKSALPVFVKTTGCEDDVPTATLPKLTFDVLGETCGADVTPLPDKVTAKVDTLLLMEMPPETAPAEDGWKDAVKFAVWPAPRVSGVGIPETAKPAPDIATLVTVKLTVPVFVRVIV